MHHRSFPNAVACFGHSPLLLFLDRISFPYLSASAKCHSLPFVVPSAPNSPGGTSPGAWSLKDRGPIPLHCTAVHIFRTMVRDHGPFSALIK
jgi:hypothetical protein